VGVNFVLRTNWPGACNFCFVPEHVSSPS